MTWLSLAYQASVSILSLYCIHTEPPIPPQHLLSIPIVFPQLPASTHMVPLSKFCLLIMLQLEGHLLLNSRLPTLHVSAQMETNLPGL